jgi:antirestriction protein ArdC
MAATHATHPTTNPTARGSSHPEAHPRAAVPGQRATDLYRTVTQQIIAAIEQGVRQRGEPLWRGQGGAQGLPYNIATGKRYRGINVLSLWIATQTHAYASGGWLTYRQAAALGGQVRRGARAVQVVYYQPVERRPVAAETGDEEPRPGIVLRTYALFNREQIDGLEPAPAATPFPRIATAEAIMAGSGAVIIEAGAQAYYRPHSDEIHLPTRERFDHAENFYAVALHELTHWTGHPHRLARNFGGRFGNESYAFEELIAELGAAFLCADLGLAAATLAGHAAYVEGWLTVLRRDKAAIFTAASHASKAHDFLLARGVPTG